MSPFTLRQEQSLVIGETLRLLVLRTGSHDVRLGIDAPAAVDVRTEARSDAAVRRRHDLIAWHPAPDQLADALRNQYPAARDDLCVIRSGIAYLGDDPTLHALMEAFVQGTLLQARRTSK